MEIEGGALLIRTDASESLGVGHFMRCLALAQGWQTRGRQVAFITACRNAGLLKRLSDEGFEAIHLDSPYPDSSDWEETSQALAAHPNAWVVLDGYHFDSAYQRRIKEAGHPLLVIDDMAHLEHYYADIMLNQNLHAEQLDYSCEPYTQLLLGTQYVLLRREFLQWQDWKREIPEMARKVLVTLGGGDPDNVTLKVVRAIKKLSVEGLEIRVVIGPSNPHTAALKEAVCHSPLTIHLLPSARNMPELMAWADVMVSAGGSTCWELTFMGLPGVILVGAENQRAVAAGLHERVAALSLGWWEQVCEQDIAEVLIMLMEDPRKRTEMSQLGQQLVDGRGLGRILVVMEEVVDEARSNR